jgi:hypothetical protein
MPNIGAVKSCLALTQTAQKGIGAENSLPNWLSNGTITYKPRRQQRRQRAQAHNSTPYRRQQSFMYWLCCKQKTLLCTY